MIFWNLVKISILIVLQATQQFKLDEKKLDASGVLSSNQSFSSLPKSVRVDFGTRSPRPFSKLRPTTDGACATLRCGRWQKAIPFGQLDGRWGRLWVDESCCNPKQNSWWVSQVTPWKFWLLSLKLASLLRCEGDDFCQKLPQFPWKTGTGLGCITVSRGSCTCKGLQSINSKDFSTNKRKLENLKILRCNYIEMISNDYMKQIQCRFPLSLEPSSVFMSMPPSKVNWETHVQEVHFFSFLY